MATAKPATTCVSIQILSLHHLPTRKESRPRLLAGKRAGCHKLLTNLSGKPSPPETSSGNVSAPSVKLELFAIEVMHVSREALPRSASRRPWVTLGDDRCGEGQRFNATFVDETLHCFATAVDYTFLRVSVIDRDQEAAYETVLLGKA